jgi:hypothetical protein
MSIFERARMALAVVLAGVLLVLSAVAAHDWNRLLPEPTPAEDVEAVHKGVAILERSRGVLTGIQPCDAIKSLLPERFTIEAGNTAMKVPTRADVIVCFRGGFDFGDAIAAAAARGLRWERGIGGDKILVFAPSESRFLQVARMNGLSFAPGEIQDPGLWMIKLQPHDRAAKAGKQWSIAPAPGDDEVLFGPYAALAPGNYKVVLNVEPETSIGCQDALRIVRVSMSVSASARTLELAPVRTLDLKPGATGGPRCLLTGELPFAVTTPVKNVETPIWVRSAILPLRVVGYEIESLP